MSIATANAIEKNKITNTSSLEEKRIELLKNEDFIKYISERTTNIEHINGRISLASESLFGIKYE